MYFMPGHLSEAIPVIRPRSMLLHGLEIISRTGAPLALSFDHNRFIDRIDAIFRHEILKRVDTNPKITPINSSSIVHRKNYHPS